MRLQLIVDVNIVRLYIKESLRENKKKRKRNKLISAKLNIDFEMENINLV